METDEEDIEFYSCAGGDAFPCGDKRGMTLRDYFAGQVLQGLVSNEGIDPAEAKVAAAWCYQMADAMLNHRVG